MHGYSVIVVQIGGSSFLLPLLLLHPMAGMWLITFLRLSELCCRQFIIMRFQRDGATTKWRRNEHLRTKGPIYSKYLLKPKTRGHCRGCVPLKPPKKGGAMSQTCTVKSSISNVQGSLFQLLFDQWSRNLSLVVHFTLWPNWIFLPISCRSQVENANEDRDLHPKTVLITWLSISAWGREPAPVGSKAEAQELSNNLCTRRHRTAAQLSKSQCGNGSIEQKKSSTLSLE